MEKMRLSSRKRSKWVSRRLVSGPSPSESWLRLCSLRRCGAVAAVCTDEVLAPRVFERVHRWVLAHRSATALAAAGCRLGASSKAARVWHKQEPPVLASEDFQNPPELAPQVEKPLHCNIGCDNQLDGRVGCQAPPGGGCCRRQAAQPCCVCEPGAVTGSPPASSSQHAGRVAVARGPQCAHCRGARVMSTGAAMEAETRFRSSPVLKNL